MEDSFANYCLDNQCRTSFTDSDKLALENCLSKTVDPDLRTRQILILEKFLCTFVRQKFELHALRNRTRKRTIDKWRACIEEIIDFYYEGDHPIQYGDGHIRFPGAYLQAAGWIGTPQEQQHSVAPKPLLDGLKGLLSLWTFEESQFRTGGQPTDFPAIQLMFNVYSFCHIELGVEIKNEKNSAFHDILEIILQAGDPETFTAKTSSDSVYDAIKRYLPRVLEMVEGVEDALAYNLT